VPGSANDAGGDVIYFAMGGPGGVPVNDPVRTPTPLAPDTTNSPALIENTGPLAALATETAAVAITTTPAPLPNLLPPDGSAKRLSDLPEVAMPAAETQAAPVAPSIPTTESAGNAATLTFVTPAASSDSHLADPASLALTDDLPVG
jgi:hypothetical protein